MKIVKMLALVSVVAVGFVSASLRAEDAAVPAAPSAPGVTNTNPCAKCGMSIDQCACKKHKGGKHHMKRTACTNVVDNAVSK